MKKIIRAGRLNYNTLTLILILLAACSVLTACGGTMSLEGGNGLISVTIGGKSARTIVPWADTLDSNNFVHTITFSGGEGGPHTETIPKGGGSVSFSVIPGKWTITAKALLLEEVLAVGGKEIEIKKGNNGNVSIQMQKPADFPSFNVSFDSKGGFFNDGSSVLSKTVNKYSKATRPETPIKSGFGFSNWYSDPDLNTEYAFNSGVTSNINLYAKWDSNYYTVKFYDGESSAATDQNIAHGGHASAPGITKTGHTSAWYKESTFANLWNFSVDVVTGDISLYVKWTPNTYIVAFDPNGGNGSMPNQSFAYGTAQNLTSNTFTRTGYTFTGWAMSPGGTAAYTNGQNVSNLVTNGTVTLYAVWMVNTYTVTFNPNGGAGSMADQSFAYGTAQNLTNNAFTKTGYTFDGWALSSGGTTAAYTNGQSVSNLTAAANGTVILYAVWKVANGAVDIPIIYH